MRNSNNIYDYGINPEVLDSMKKINEEIKEEIAEGNPNGQKLNEMQMNYLLKGMQLQNNIYNNNFGRHIPW